MQKHTPVLHDFIYNSFTACISGRNCLIHLFQRNTFDIAVCCGIQKRCPFFTVDFGNSSLHCLYGKLCPDGTGRITVLLSSARPDNTAFCQITVGQIIFF